MDIDKVYGEKSDSEYRKGSQSLSRNLVLRDLTPQTCACSRPVFLDYSHHPFSVAPSWCTELS